MLCQLFFPLLKKKMQGKLLYSTFTYSLNYIEYRMYKKIVLYTCLIGESFRRTSQDIYCVQYRKFNNTEVQCGGYSRN